MYILNIGNNKSKDYSMKNQNEIEIEAKFIYNDLKSQGFDKKQIADCMCDGEVLAKDGIDQEVAEFIFEMCK